MCWRRASHGFFMDQRYLKIIDKREIENLMDSLRGELKTNGF